MFEQLSWFNLSNFLNFEFWNLMKVEFSILKIHENEFQTTNLILKLTEEYMLYWYNW